MKKRTIPSPIYYTVGNIPILVTYEKSEIANNLDTFSEPFNSAGIKFITATIMNNTEIHLSAYNMTEPQAREYGKYIKEMVRLELVQ